MRELNIQETDSVTGGLIPLSWIIAILDFFGCLEI
jgi:hypothetical protein